MSRFSKMKRSLPPIPDLPASVDAATRAAFSALKEALEVRLGRRGDPLEEAVTRRDLIDSGLARRRSSIGAELEPIEKVEPGSQFAPPAPRGFQAIGIFGGVTLTWENPFQEYNVHAFTEVWRSETDNLDDAILINSSRGSTFFDRHDDQLPVAYWYWVRFLSEYNLEGAYAGPRLAQKQEDVRVILERISGEIDESSLTEAFRADYEGLTDTVVRHDQEIQAQGSSISQQMGLITQQEGTLAALAAQYTVRLNVNGYISGFGAYNSGSTSDFTVVADRFWIAAPNSSGRIKPFIIQGGRTYIDSAVIRDGTIQEGKLGPITFGKIVDMAGRSVTTLAGKLRADYIDVTNLQVTDANIAGVIKSNARGVNGQPRWMLDKNGGFVMNGAGTVDEEGNVVAVGGRLEMRDDVIKVFDGNGQVRVQIGNLNA